MRKSILLTLFLSSTRGATYVIKAQAYDSAGNMSSHQVTIKTSGLSTTKKSWKCEPQGPSRTSRRCHLQVKEDRCKYHQTE